MKKNKFKFIYILFAIVCFIALNNNVKASLNVKVDEKTNYQLVFTIENGDNQTESTAYCKVKLVLDESTHIPTLYTKGLSDKDYVIRSSLSSNITEYYCDGEKIKFNMPLNKPLQTLIGTTVGVTHDVIEIDDYTTMTNSDYVIVDGLSEFYYNVNTGYKKVECAGPNHRFEMQLTTEAGKIFCQVLFYNDENGNIIMLSGVEILDNGYNYNRYEEKVVNPQMGEYVCYYPNHNRNFSTKFKLLHSFKKGEWDGLDGCPIDSKNDPYIVPFNSGDTLVGQSQGTAADSQTIQRKIDEIYASSRITRITFSNIFGTINGSITCTGALKNTLPILKDIFKYIRIAAALLFIVLTSLDYIKAIADSDQSVFKKSNQRLVKRVIILISIIILPSIINLVLAIVQLSSGSCGIN